MKLGGSIWDPLYFPTSLSDCLWHVLLSRYSPLSPKITDKPNKCKGFLAPIFFGKYPQLFCGRLLARPTVHRLAKFGWVLLADLRLRNLAMKWNLWRAGENSAPFWSRLWSKVHVVFRWCRRPLETPVVCNALARLSISCFVLKI